MLRLRKANDRGHVEHGWLESYHTFSFSTYHDPGHMRFRSLRVMNEDCVAPGQGFGTHAHHDMEIVTYVLGGALEHKDSIGNGEVLRPGELQRMTAGTGITHSEFNPSESEPVHFYQIWILPESKGLEPSYEQKSFPLEDRHHQWQLVASPEGTENSLTIHQDVKISLANLDATSAIDYEFAAERHGWLQVLSGTVQLFELQLEAGDGVALSDETTLHLVSSANTELMLIDLA